MARGHLPSTILCTCAGGLIGAVSAVMISSAGLSALSNTSPPLLTISSFKPEALHSDADVASWTGSISGVLRAAMGLAVETISIRQGDTLADVLSDAGLDKHNNVQRRSGDAGCIQSAPSARRPRTGTCL